MQTLFFDFVLFFIVFGSHFFWCLETQTQQLNSALVDLKQVQIIKKTKRIKITNSKHAAIESMKIDLHP